MTGREVESFTARPFAVEAIRLRKWDDQGNVPGAPVPEIRAFVPLMIDVLG